jgi:hypothetical protein
MKMRHFLLTTGVAIAAWLAFFGDKTPAADIAEPINRASASGTAKASTLSTAVPAAAAGSTAALNTKAQREPVILALQARENLIGGDFSAPRTNNLFASQSWVPPPSPPPPPLKPLPPPPPAAPPMPFTYLGKKIEAGSWEVFLARGDQTFIVHEQSVVEGIYQIDAIKPPTLTVTYLPLKQVQTLTIGGTD